MKIAKNNSNISPSARLMRLVVLPLRIMSLAQNNIARADRITNGISLLIMLFSTFIGITRATHPIIMRILKILLPTTFPIANSALPLIADNELITNSGADVPKATIVRPITRSLTPHFFATDEAPSVSPLAPSKMRTNPPIKRRIFSIIRLQCSFS